MLRKQTLIVMLAGLNLLLLAALVISATALPAAYAQPGGAGAGYIGVTAVVSGQGYEVLYLLDRPQRKLHAFYPNLQTSELAYGGFRDLKEDFRAEGTP
ncbi:MAG TPA: hypothetical protein PKK06_02600 [Phycisphaerae bacterium]|nr:hypothetical protein [Phycisphaerae bacterium]HNU44575.1 hypothetical protein [Phycisphaerae bacterium]